MRLIKDNKGPWSDFICLSLASLVISYDMKYKNAVIVTDENKYVFDVDIVKLSIPLTKMRAGGQDAKCKKYSKMNRIVNSLSGQQIRRECNVYRDNECVVLCVVLGE